MELRHLAAIKRQTAGNANASEAVFFNIPTTALVKVDCAELSTAFLLCCRVIRELCDNSQAPILLGFQALKSRLVAGFSGVGLVYFW